MTLDQTFNVRFSSKELFRLKMEAKAKGWSVGRLIRFRALGEELNQERRLARLEKKLMELGEKDG